MKEHIPQHENCEHAEALVSYLYGEIGAGEKARFEKHLELCPICPEELAGFALIRSSIAEWRSLDFEPLHTPRINLQVEDDKSSKISLSQSWGDYIRNLFALPQVWKAAGAFAVLAICIGAVIMAFNFLPKNELAKSSGVEKTNEAPAVNENSQVEKSVNETSLASVDNDKSPVDENSSGAVESINESKTSVSAPAAPIKISQSAASRAVNSRKQLKSAPAEKSVIQSPARKASKVPPPTLLADESEEDTRTLRLSDLFDEIGKG